MVRHQGYATYFHESITHLMTNRYSVRLLSSDGNYPAAPLLINDFALLVADEFAWMAVHLPDLDDSESARPESVHPAGEISWLTPEEIRFLGAVSLAEPHPGTNGRLWTYAPSWRDTLEVDFDAAAHPDHFIEQSRVVAASIVKTPLTDRMGEPDINRRPETVKRDYTDSVRNLLQAMDAYDPLLHRGLYKLVMAADLRRYPRFLEESALSALISREVALELLRRRLSSRSRKRLKKEDVFSHIERTFPTGEPFVEVLRTAWEARVMMTHPMSDYGEHWSPPVHADKCFDALDSLTYLYRYLLLDEVWTPGEYD